MSSLYTSREAEDMGGILDALPRWLKPPQAVRTAVASEYQKLTHPKVTIPTPSGPVTVDTANPGELARLWDMLKGIRISIGAPGGGGSAADQVDRGIRNQVPGGYLGIAIGVLGALALWQALRPQRRRA